MLIADYFLLRKQKLNVADLYLRGGFNWKAIGAMAAGVVVALIGLLVPSLAFLYDYAWFVGFAVAFVVYAAIMKR